MAADADVSHIEPLGQHEGKVYRDCTGGPDVSHSKPRWQQLPAPGGPVLRLWLLWLLAAGTNFCNSPLWAASASIREAVLCWAWLPAVMSATRVAVAVSACTRKSMVLCWAWLLAQPVEVHLHCGLPYPVAASATHLRLVLLRHVTWPAGSKRQVQDASQTPAQWRRLVHGRVYAEQPAKEAPRPAGENCVESQSACAFCSSHRQLDCPCKASCRGPLEHWRASATLRSP